MSAKEEGGAVVRAKRETERGRNKKERERERERREAREIGREGGTNAEATACRGPEGRSHEYQSFH